MNLNMSSQHMHNQNLTFRCAVVFLAAMFLTIAEVASADITSNRITLPQARFSTGDDIAWRDPDFDDSAWKVLSTTQYYEDQGFAGYNGYSWYRIHVVIPSTLKASTDWPERLRVYLSAIDDTDETYLNGIPIGKTGRMPSDPKGYESRWETIRDYAVDLRNGIVRWDRDNVIAVRVYDGNGGGGFYKDLPYLAMPQRVDGLQLDAGQARYHFLGNGRVRTTLNLRNKFPVMQRGVLKTQVYDQVARRVLVSESRLVSIEPEKSVDVSWTWPTRPGIQVRYRFIDAVSGRNASSTHDVPYRLTPPDAPEPVMHGARLLGARPGTPLHYRIAATGRAPLHYSAEGLPRGLTLNSDSGVISGTTPDAGSYRVSLRVRNSLGSTSRVWTLESGEQLALTPPMGWNSWNAYGLNVSDTLVRNAAQALIDKGLAAKGWNSINIDDGWEAPTRRADGKIIGNERFPDMPALGIYLHERGLHFGIYSSPGSSTCGGYLGSLDHELQDAASYAQWGVDYLKYDLCSYSANFSSTPTLEEHQKPYRLMGDALRNQPRSIVFSLCQYGEKQVWTWGPSVGGSSWRMTGDIFDAWSSVQETGFSLAPYTHFVAPGRWNDPDMLVVGQLGWGDKLRPSRLTPDEQYSHISLWSLLAAPLLLGNDLPSLDEFTLSLLTNHDVIAINQDALGKSARRIQNEDDWQVWAKELEGGAQAVGIFNMGSSSRSTRITTSILGHKGRLHIRDAWRQKDLGFKSKYINAQVPAHGVMLLIVK